MKELIDIFIERYPMVDRDAFWAYLDHIQKSKLPEREKGNWHHILPKSMFPEYKSRVGHPWNSVKISPFDHFKAHYLLFRAVKCQATAYAWKMMSKMGKIKIEDEYLQEYERAVSVVKDQCGKTMRGKVAAKDKNGDIYHVETNDPRLKDGSLTHFARYTVNVKDSLGNRFKVRKDDPRYLSGELVHVRKGRITTKDKAGIVIDTTCDDPRLITGELTHVNKGYVLTIDKDGVYKRVRVTDPAYQNGDLIHARTGYSPDGSPVSPNIKSRLCPQCKKRLIYKNKYHCKIADKTNGLCGSCAAKNRCAPLYTKTERHCPVCGVSLHYKYAWLCKQMEERGSVCRKCSSMARAKRLRWPQTRWDHQISGIINQKEEQ